MKEGWERKQLGKVAVATYGYTEKASFEEIGPKFLRITDIQDDGVNWDAVPYCKINEDEFQKYRLSNGDIVFARTGATTGKSYHVFNPPKSVFASYLIKVHINDPGLSSEFLYLFFQTKSYWDKISEGVSGSAQGGFNATKLSALEIPIPPLSEQHRIVTILDETFASIVKAKANAKQNLKNARELFESYLQSVFTDEGDGWEEKTLGEVLLKTETVDPTKKPNKKFIYLDVSSVNKETKEIENATVLLGKDAPSRAKKLVRTNDVIFATVRPTHSRVAIITEEYNGQVCSTGYFVLRAKDFLSNNLVYHFLLTSSFNKQMEKLQKGASYPAVTDSEVKSIIITFPKSMKEQQSIVQKLDTLSTKTKKLETIYQQKLNDLEELKRSLLQKAFKGELKNGN
jgi:type I restriction enzyme S subunit